ncbi:hypothetical protein SEUCBS140593_008179 [Sporothrix eucalyptigena]|uniref:Uncharacterized protein n=1 Tax=Sporothrix eucalyptigena TaxID=1812306 RepID=A0ABP0CJB7_9PEZI
MTHESSNEVKSVNRNLLQLGYAAQKFDEKTEAFHNRLLEKLDFMNKDREQTVSAAKSQNAALVLLSEYFKKERNQLSLEIRRSLTPVPQSVYELVMEPEDLLDILMVPLSLANADMMTCARHKTGFSDQVLQQAQSLVSTEKFNYWLQSERSETLLVDGNDEQNMRGMITPMSVLTATLSSALEGAYGKEGFIPLQFWCSMHTRRRDDVQGPLGMMRALLVQLVAALLNRNINQKFNFGDVNEKEFLGDLEEGCFRALKQTLKMLLELVPCELPVFFFIDDVSSFEDQRFCEDLHDVVGMLDCFVEENRNKIKVLYTFDS